MKTASALIQIFALGMVFTAHVAAPEDFRMPGVRRAMQTMSVASPAAVPDLSIDAEI